MNIRLIILGILFFVCCNNNETQVNYFYSDGTVINKESDILHIENEIQNIVSEFKTTNDVINVYTTLNNNYKIKLNEQYDSIISIIYEHYPEKKELIDSLYFNNKLFKTGIFALENKTGKIILNYSYPEKSNQIYSKHPLGSMSKLFLYTLAMDKQYDPYDLYPRTTQIIKDSILIEVRDTTSKRNFHHTFSLSSGSPINPLDKQYDKKEFIELLELLKCDYSSNDTSKLGYFRWNLSLYDITKTHTIFKNKGKLVYPYLIDSIIDNNEVILYKAKTKSEKVINDTTASEMMELLEYFINSGMGSSIRWKYKYLEDIAGRSGNANYKTFWFVGISNEITIGVTFSINLTDKPFRFMTCIKANNSVIPIWYETIQMIKNDSTFNY